MLGHGGYGAVFVAEQISVGRRCAVKVLVPDIASDMRNTRRFEREAQLTSKLAHPHTVVLYDFGFDEERRLLFLAMEYIAGRSLRELIDQRGTLDVTTAVKITHQAARSLDDAHRNGLVHRDVKPHNIMITNRGDDETFVKVIDFGIATFLNHEDVRETIPNVTATGTVVGTPSYMAPEQLRKQELDGRTDQYALAISVYEMLAGRPVFVADSPVDLATRHLIDKPLPLRALNRSLDVSGEFEDVLLRALGKSADERFPTIREFADALVDAAGLPLAVASTLGSNEHDRQDRLRVPQRGPADEADTDVDAFARTAATPVAASEATTRPSVRSDSDYAPDDAEDDVESAPGEPRPKSRDDVPGFTMKVSIAEDSAPSEEEAWSFAAEEAPARPASTRTPSGLLMLIAAAVGVVGALGVATVFLADSSPTADDLVAGQKTTAPTKPTVAAPLPTGVEPSDGEVDRARAGTAVEPSVRSESAAPATEQPGKASPLLRSGTPPASDAEPDAPDETAGREEGKETETAVTGDGGDKMGADETVSDTGAVTVMVLPWGDLYVDGKRRGAGRRHRLELTVGKHQLELRQNGEARARKTVDVQAGQNTMIELIAR